MALVAQFDRAVPLKDAAELGGVSTKTLKRAVYLREIDVVRMKHPGGTRARILIRLSALDRWLKRLTEPASRVRGGEA